MAPANARAEGGPAIAETQVCAQRQAEGTEQAEKNEQCAYTLAGGEYAIEGLSAGDYLVTFLGEACPGRTCHPEYAPQFFEGATDRSEATEVELTEETERGWK